jgi:tetratricopeptide (TPR) repeat protein
LTSREKSKDVREIGRELNVETVLEGSVRRGGDQLRITAQLINVADGFHLWSETWSRTPDDVFAIQDEISLAIAEKLKLDLLGDERTKVVKRSTENLEAMDYFRQARFHANKGTAEGFLRAIDLFKEAIARDSSFALAHAELSNTYAVAPALGTMPTPVANALAKEHALRAEQLDDQLEEARGAFLTAIDLDPFALNAVRNLGRLYYFSGEYEPAVEILNEVLVSNPNFSFVFMTLALVTKLGLD